MQFVVRVAPGRMCGISGNDIKLKYHLCFLKLISTQMVQQLIVFMINTLYLGTCTRNSAHFCISTCWILLRKSKHVSAIYVIPPHWNAYVIEILPPEHMGLRILCCQYHCCWWSGDLRSQGISSHDIGRICPELSWRLRDEEQCYKYTGCSRHVKILWLSGWFMWGRVCSTDSSCIYKNMLDLVMLHRPRPRE